MRHFLPSLALWLIGSFTVLSHDWPPWPEPSLRQQTAEERAEKKLAERIEKIVIPKVEFREAPLSEVVKFLQAEAKRLDSKRPEITIDLERPDVEPTITCSLLNLSLSDALSHVRSFSGLLMHQTKTGVILTLASKKTPPRFEQHALSLPKEIFGKDARPQDYGVNPEVISEFLADPLKCMVSGGILEQEISHCSLDRDALVLSLVATSDAIGSLHGMLGELFPSPVPGPNKTAIPSVEAAFRKNVMAEKPEDSLNFLVKRIGDSVLENVDLVDCPIGEAVMKLDASMKAASEKDIALGGIKIQIAEEPEEEARAFAQKRVTLQAPKIAVMTALKEIAQQAGGIVYRNPSSALDGENFAWIEIGPPESTPPLFTLEYRVPPGGESWTERVSPWKPLNWVMSSGEPFGLIKPNAIYLPDSRKLILFDRRMVHERIAKKYQAAWKRYYASAEWKAEQLRVQRLRQLFPHWSGKVFEQGVSK